MKKLEYITGLEIYTRVIRNRSKLPDRIINNESEYYKVVDNDKIKDLNLLYYNGKEYLKLSEIKNFMATYKIEHNILDNDEKRYLKNVIRPFKNQVLLIRKYSYCEYEYLSIFIKEIDGDKTSIELPMFEEGSMYKNMILGEDYSLEELELR